MMTDCCVAFTYLHPRFLHEPPQRGERDEFPDCPEGVGIISTKFFLPVLCFSEQRSGARKAINRVSLWQGEEIMGNTMITLKINNTTTILMVKFFGEDAATECVQSVLGMGARRVVFLDPPATTHLVSAISALTTDGVEVVVRDHHDVPAPRSQRDEEIRAAAQAVRELLGERATISHRATHPACSTLLQVGEFAGEGTVIVADPDADGLTAAMKAVGVTYEGLDEDAAVLDGPRSEQVAGRLSPLALLLVKGLATVPAYDQARPQVSEGAKATLFEQFAKAASGDEAALKGLTDKVTAYEAGVAEAERLAATATEPLPGVVMVDVVGSPAYDLTTLAARLEARPGCRVTVVRKDTGPIAGFEKKAGRPGIQYSLAVPKARQEEVNLQSLLPQGFTSSPASGIISNTSFLLHVSETVWAEKIFWGLSVWCLNW